MKLYLLFCLIGAMLSAFPARIVEKDDCAGIDWVSREDWGAKDADLEPLKVPVKHVFIHHTAEGFCKTRDVCSQNMREMQKFHNETRGWGDIGYSFCVGGDGGVYVGRGYDKFGRHTKAINYASIGISLMGNFHLDYKAPENMLEATRKTISCGIAKGFIHPDYELHGHRDQTCTACPGKHLYALIKTWPHFVEGPLPTYVC